MKHIHDSLDHWEFEERIFMPKLPPKMKKHLFLKTPKLMAHIATKLQMQIKDGLVSR